MTKKEPLVSIIIPVYNGSNFVREAIDSAISQTYKNVEVIVVNDGSTDDTEKIALSYGDKIRYFKKENGGVSSALNFGIRVMRGDFFSWLSHDDKYAPQKIEHQINALQKYQDDMLIAYCDTMQIDSNNQIIRKSRTNRYLKSYQINSWQNSLKALFKCGCFSGCALLIPKKAFEEVGEFDESLRYIQDMYMWTKILLKGYSIIYCCGDYVMSRVHNGQLTATGRDIFVSDTIKYAKLALQDLKNQSTSRYRFAFLLAKYFARYNCVDATKYYMQNANLSFLEKICIRFVAIYGKVRPLIKKIYRIIFRIK